MLKKGCFHLVLLAFAINLSFGQGAENKPSYWQIKPVINQGFILVHRATIGHLVKGYPTIYELNLSKSTSGDKLWQLENNLPDIGISFQCVDFKNPNQLGYAFTASPYVEIPLNKIARTSRVVMRLCLGATYLNKKFDIHKNPKNIAIGSHFNSFVQFKWLWHLKLSESLRFEPGFAFTHASNGKTRTPNLGLNIVSINAGLNYLIKNKPIPSKSSVDSSTKVKSKNEVLTFASIGFNQQRTYGPTLKCYLYSIAYQRNVRNAHKFSAGIDLFYEENYFLDYENEFNKPLTGFDKLRASVRLGYSYHVGRVSFPIELGYYFLQKYNSDAMVVSRIGVRYYSPTGIVGHFGLRTHYAVAYNFEYGIGYRFFIR